MAFDSVWKDLQVLWRVGGWRSNWRRHHQGGVGLWLCNFYQGWPIVFVIYSSEVTHHISIHHPQGATIIKGGHPIHCHQIGFCQCWSGPKKSILGSDEELIKYAFTIYDLNDDGYIRCSPWSIKVFDLCHCYFSKDEMMTLLKNCLVQKDDGGFGYLRILYKTTLTSVQCFSINAVTKTKTPIFRATSSPLTLLRMKCPLKIHVQDGWQWWGSQGTGWAHSQVSHHVLN